MAPALFAASDAKTWISAHGRVKAFAYQHLLRPVISMKVVPRSSSVPLTHCSIQKLPLAL